MPLILISILHDPPRLKYVWTLCQWLFAAAIIGVVYGVAYHRGVITGEQGVGYWQGWQDAMIQTAYGTIPVHTNKMALEK